MPKATEIRPASEVTQWDGEADVVVVGLGCAGASAAMEAHDQGAEVLVLERAGGGGGTSADSGGLIYLGGGTPVQKATGFDDTPEELFKFLMAVASPGPNEQKIRLFSESSAGSCRWWSRYRRTGRNGPSGAHFPRTTILFVSGPSYAG